MCYICLQPWSFYLFAWFVFKSPLLNVYIIIVINISVSLSFSCVTYLIGGSCFHHLFFWKVNLSADTKPTHIGEAVFVDDIPAPKDCVYGAFIYSTEPLAHVKSIELNPSLKQLKTLGVVTVKDIPEGGSNVGANTIFGPEPLFGDPVTQCAGEPLGLVVWFCSYISGFKETFGLFPLVMKFYL